MEIKNSAVAIAALGAGLPALLLALAGCATTAVAPTGPQPCSRVSLDPAPAWGHDPVWGNRGRELVLMDIAGGRLLRYTKGGDYLGVVARPGRGPLEFTHPTHLLGIGDGYLLFDHADHLIWFDREFRPLRSLDFRDEAGNPRFNLGGAALLTGGREMLATASTKRNGTWWHGFVRFRLEPPEILEFIREVPEDSAADLMYRLHAPGIAVAGEAVYALVYSEIPSVVRLTSPQESLAAFPQEFAGLPTLPDGTRGAADAAALYAALEAASYPVALYGRGEYLYLLTRKPRPERGTLWQLTQIDPRRDAIVRTVALPTDANHLDLAPGPEWWALVEKGPVIRQGSQAFGPAVFVPSRWIEDPVLGDQADVEASDCR